MTRAICVVVALCASGWALASPLQTEPSASQVVVQLSSGDAIRGTVVRSDDTTVVVQHSVLGQLQIPRASIVKVEVIQANRPATNDAPAAGDVPADAQVLPPGPQDAQAGANAPPLKPKSPWRATIAAAVNYTDNNDTTIDARVAAGLEYKIPDVQNFALNGEYFFKTLNSNTTDNNLLLNAVYDRYITDTNWLWFLKAQYQYSQFEAWEHRISGYGGAGYRFFREPPFELLLKVGAGGTHEFGPPQQTLPEGYGEIQLAWAISKLQRLELSSNIAPDLSNFGEFRIISRAEWQLKLDPELDLALTLGVRSQYQSQVPAGDVSHDLRIYAGLQMGF